MANEALIESGHGIAKYKRFRTFISSMGERINPTEKQYAFASHYLKHQDAEAAYKHAGYMDLTTATTCKAWRRGAYKRVLQSKAVRQLMSMALFEWSQKRNITAKVIADRLLHIADTAENLNDQIAALTELNKMLDYHNAPSHQERMNRVLAAQRRLERHAA